jgi:hypothetical protein
VPARPRPRHAGHLIPPLWKHCTNCTNLPAPGPISAISVIRAVILLWAATADEGHTDHGAEPAALPLGNHCCESVHGDLEPVRSAYSRVSRRRRWSARPRAEVEPRQARLAWASTPAPTRGIKHRHRPLARPVGPLSVFGLFLDSRLQGPVLLVNGPKAQMSGRKPRRRSEEDVAN